MADDVDPSVAEKGGHSRTLTIGVLDHDETTLREQSPSRRNHRSHLTEAVGS